MIGNQASSFTFPDMQTVIAQPESLENFSFYLWENIYDKEHEPAISNRELWNCLQQHKHNLQVIDVYRDAAVHCNENGHF